MQRRLEILRKIVTVDSLPSASAEVMRLVQDPDSSTSEIARAIEFDPSLTSNVLRLANSAWLGMPMSVRTARDALIRLGRKRVFQIVIATSVGRYVRQPVQGYGLGGQDLWDHVVMTALGAEKLGAALGIAVPDYTFTAGLLHDIGKIVLGFFVESDAEAIHRLVGEEKVSFEVAERRVLGIDHMEVGAHLLAEWNLPSEMVDVVRWHHEPERCPNEPLVVSLVHVSDVLSLMAGMGRGVDGLHYEPSSRVVSNLGIHRKTLETVLVHVTEELDAVRETFRFD